MSAAPSHRALRICHLGKFYPPAPGGMETHVQTLARAQAQLGATVEVLCINHRNANGEDVTHQALASVGSETEQDEGVQVRRLARIGSVARLDLAPELPRALLSLKARSFDLLHLHAPNPAMLMGLLPLPIRLPLVITHHSDVIRQRALGKLFRPIELWGYSRAALILSTSSQYIEGSSLLRRFRTKVRALPLGIDLSPFLSPSAAARAHAARLHEQHGDLLWLSVGRLVYYKGLETALRALPHVRGKLLIVGTGPDTSRLERQARALNVSDRVVFCGHLTPDELVGAYLAATALWFPSNARSEAYGLAQVEALATGCPVINAAIPNSGVCWVSRHDETGLTVPVDDARALADAAERLSQDRELRTRFSQAAVSRAQLEFDHRQMAERSLELYQQMLHAEPTLARFPKAAIP